MVSAAWYPNKQSKRARGTSQGHTNAPKHRMTHHPRCDFKRMAALPGRPEAAPGPAVEGEEGEERTFGVYMRAKMAKLDHQVPDRATTIFEGVRAHVNGTLLLTKRVLGRERGGGGAAVSACHRLSGCQRDVHARVASTEMVHDFVVEAAGLAGVSPWVVGWWVGGLWVWWGNVRWVTACGTTQSLYPAAPCVQQVSPRLACRSCGISFRFTEAGASHGMCTGGSACASPWLRCTVLPFVWVITPCWTEQCVQSAPSSVP
jgi:hypothetical protein